MTLQNATTNINGMDAINTISPAFGWLITIVIFFITIGIIFLLSKNIRQFFYGSIVTTFLLINYKFSRWVGVSTMNNDYTTLKWTCYVIGFIIVSIILGRLAQKLPFIKKLEEKINDKN